MSDNIPFHGQYGTIWSITTGLLSITVQVNKKAVQGTIEDEHVVIPLFAPRPDWLHTDEELDAWYEQARLLYREFMNTQPVTPATTHSQKGAV